jgi:hypothetical protein
MTTVKQLIEFLQTQNQEAEVEVMYSADVDYYTETGFADVDLASCETYGRFLRLLTRETK